MKDVICEVIFGILQEKKRMWYVTYIGKLYTGLFKKTNNFTGLRN